MEQHDVNMADSNTPALLDDMKIETSEEDYDDISSTDESSVEDAHFVPIGLPARGLPTGLCYDVRMRYHAEVSALTAEAVHPEDPRRIYYIYKELCEAGLVKQNGFELMVQQPLERIEARYATFEEIMTVHTEKEYRFVESTSSELVGRC